MQSKEDTTLKPKAYSAKAYSAASATSPLASDHDPAPRPDRTRRADRDPLLRHLPLRPSLRPRRVARCDARRSTPACRATRSSAASRRSGRPSRSSRRATSSASAAWSTPTAPAPTAEAGLEQFCPNQVLTYGSPGQARDRAGHLRRLLRQHRRGRALRPAHPVQPRPRRCRAAALRRHHDLLAAASLGRRPRARRSASSASAASATWA